MKIIFFFYSFFQMSHFLSLLSSKLWSNFLLTFVTYLYICVQMSMCVNVLYSWIHNYYLLSLCIVSFMHVFRDDHSVQNNQLCSSLGKTVHCNLSSPYLPVVLSMGFLLLLSAHLLVSPLFCIQNLTDDCSFGHIWKYRNQRRDETLLCFYPEETVGNTLLFKFSIVLGHYALK